ncbi:bifunctional glycosyltransferase family 2 protein/CDP-glycerol:glycerophosphate glycerophosphotransferase [Actinomadura barringtoniae]|uniref:Bifunctional glycosyltransferase family 2 protein/CDP-glycerol:glycerophosphate glycerophosphotransferase n=1 Tax=Actinomadura barringtoniae TaxID=1427535 RepID=A0A939T6V6_9ACTN|nr:bifunctional glycosyltransferase family 2 protein/CDP-glycerol:glycerophosphate glycerophosphotransferase [Actinomadura barringtoniae]MBO2452408.1 bifunctional glycosyltransferase family 2 protein/CDP-glycerol:glycerophosphate glycerophosphotransferase [Actinomadura barringtoniae]
MTVAPLLSVVVPFYGVEDYLQACLESLRRQTLKDLEVIMVDDGSPDGSAAIAKAFAGRDGRFHLVQQDNQGLGPARNTGAGHATGRYLAFMDSDDVVPRYAYELMVGSLEETGSDIACGGVRRFTVSGLKGSGMHSEIFKTAAKRTHISRRTNLLGDRTAWNKVFRKSFWDANDFVFPPGLYEDAPVTLPAHFLAGSVDVLSDAVYYWREREGESLSITQRRTEPGNIEDRVSSILAVASFLHGRAPRLWQEFLTSALNAEIPLYIDVAGEGDDEYRDRLRAQVISVITTADASMVTKLTALKRLKYHLLVEGMFGELAEVLTFQQGEIRTTDLVQRGGRWLAEYPYLGDRARRIPQDLYDVTDELHLLGRADRATWHDGRLQIEGHAYISRVPLAEEGDGEIRVWLQDVKRGTRIELDARRTYRPDVSANARRAAADYDWAGFTAEVEANALKPIRALGLKMWWPSTWELHAEVTMRSGLRRTGVLAGPRRSDAQWAAAHDVTKDLWVRPVGTPDDRYVLQVKRSTCQVTRAGAEGVSLLVEGWAKGARRSADVTLVLERKQGMTAIQLPVHVNEPGTFTARIPGDVLVSQAQQAAAVDGEGEAEAERVNPAEGLDYDVSLRVGEGQKPVRLSVRDDVEARVAIGPDEVVITRTKYGNLRLVERPRRPVVTAAAWSEDGRLALSGEMPGDDRPDHLVLRLRNSGDRHTVPLAWTGARFIAGLTPGSMHRFGEELPLASGNWDVYAPMPAGEMAVVVSRATSGDLPGPHVAGGRKVELTLYQGEALRFVVQPALEDEERGLYGQKRLRLNVYPTLLKAPLRELAVFESFRGRQYSDSPRYIFEEMQRRRPDLDYVWVTLDDQFRVPEGVRKVVHGSRAHFQALAQARYLVGNDPMPEWLEKRDGQFYLQTWHGTPLKRIGHDIEHPLFRNARDYLRRFDSDVAQWDALVSPNPFSTPILRRAFRFDGEVLESGYPRNDLLARPDTEGRGARVRATLGIPEGKRVVLYAPTWRDDQARAGGYRMDLRIDLDAARRALGDDHVLLVRGHFNVGEGVPGVDGRFTFDVSRYPDIAELYLIADVLVTDYSSVMFDFAVTGRPQLFFAYDYERYRDELRGFYFDFEAEAPGPLCRTSADLIEALHAAPATREDHAARYAAFREKYCAWDDGSASARAVDRLLT